LCIGTAPLIFKTMLRIVHASDFHNRQGQATLPDGDILVVSGDLTNFGTETELEDFFTWIDRTYYIYKIVIPGNHDISLDKAKTDGETPKWVSNIIKNFTRHSDLHYYLCHESCNLWGLKIFGSPYVPKVRDMQPTRWGFSLDRRDMINYWVDIPKDTDILITHGPPFGKQDWCEGPIFPAGPMGDEALRYMVKFIKPKLHMFGHIHEANGVCYDEDTVYSNAALMDPLYNITQKPRVFDFDEKKKEVHIIQ
jgi:hypothetical protein